MAKRTLQALTLILALAFVSLMAFSVIAGGGEAGETGDTEKESSFMSHLHALGQKLHGMHGGAHRGDGHHDGGHRDDGHHGSGHADMGHHMAHFAQLVEQMNLSEEQYKHFERIHEVLGNHGGGHDAMQALHEQLMEEFQGGYIGSENIRLAIDQHIEAMRAVAYGVTDELVTLINGLNAEQREILTAHMEQVKSSS